MGMGVKGPNVFSIYKANFLIFRSLSLQDSKNSRESDMSPPQHNFFKEICSQKFLPHLRNKLFGWDISSHINVSFYTCKLIHFVHGFSRGLSRLHATKIKQSHCRPIFKKWSLMLTIIFSGHLKFKIMPIILLLDLILCLSI